ncbi:MAG: hypothetical protein ACKPKO_31375, partial [Candidatus Fonsibacter sp.]
MISPEALVPDTVIPKAHAALIVGTEGFGLAGYFIPSPPPETSVAYAKRSEESAGDIGMIDIFIKYLDKELTEAKAEEVHAQEEVVAMMQDSAEKRTVDSKALRQKISVKADLQGLLEEHIGLKYTTQELKATLEYAQSIHVEREDKVACAATGTAEAPGEAAPFAAPLCE